MESRPYTDEIWEAVLEAALAAEGTAAPPDPGDDPTGWVIDCMMGCYNFIEPEIE